MEWSWAEDRAPVGTDPSADPGVVSEDRAAATLPPTSLAYNTHAINPTVTQPDNSAVTNHPYPANSANAVLRFTLNQDNVMGGVAGYGQARHGLTGRCDSV
jgi:hypothetical protein